jgi:hypothetical protein
VKFFLGIFWCFLVTSSIAQLFEQQVWVETGVKYNLNKKLGASFDLTQRYGYDGLRTLFPQLSVRYKVTPWFRTSLDYRLIRSKSTAETYDVSQRINANLQFSQSYKRLELGLRIRYQYSFDRLGGAYDSEFDQAWRIKPGAEYNIKGLPITPSLSAEFFYNPENSVIGKQFNRIRYYAGTTIELTHSQGIELGLYFDQWINGVPRKRLMYSVSYVISLGAAKKENKKPSKNLRDL